MLSGEDWQWFICTNPCVFISLASVHGDSPAGSSTASSLRFLSKCLLRKSPEFGLSLFWASRGISHPPRMLWVKLLEHLFLTWLGQKVNLVSAQIFFFLIKAKLTRITSFGTIDMGRRSSCHYSVFQLSSHCPQITGLVITDHRLVPALPSTWIS